MEQANLDYINELSGDNSDFKTKIFEILKRELPKEITIYHDQIQSRNYLQAAGCVHKLKHKISILGLKKSYYIAEQFEDNLKDNSTELKSDFDAIIKIMQDFVDKL